MSGTSPDFKYWSTRPTLRVWFVAAMMQGVDPRAMADVTDVNGDAIDISDDIDLLISACLVGDITAYPVPGQHPDKQTALSKASLEKWLRTHGYVNLADELDTSSTNTGLTPPAATAPITSPGPSTSATATVTTNGTGVIWTPARKLEAKAMLASEQASGAKAYAANTAKAFGVSTARLRAVLVDKSKLNPVKKTAPSWFSRP